MLRKLPRPLSDIVLLVARLILAVVLFAHGMQKVTNGYSATADGFASMGIPFAEGAAAFAIAVEVGGSVLIALGLFTAVAGVLAAATMAGAYVFAHSSGGVFDIVGGWELVGALAALGLALAASGAGRLSLDAVLPRLSGRNRAASAPRRRSTASVVG